MIFSAKDTISKVYDRNFRDIFARVYESEFREQYEMLGISYQYCLIDDAVSRVIKSHGGYVWACQNYDGDVMSDMLATAYGSAAMMTSVLVSPDGQYEYEAAHGTVAGISTNTGTERKRLPPIRLPSFWHGPARLRSGGDLDGNEPLKRLAAVCGKLRCRAVEYGIMTADLIPITSHPEPKMVTGGCSSWMRWRSG